MNKSASNWPPAPRTWSFQNLAEFFNREDAPALLVVFTHLSMWNSKPAALFAGVVAAGAMLFLAITLRGGWPPHVDAEPHRSVGAVLARQALSLLSVQGEVIIIARDTSTFKNPATDIQLASFKKTLRRGHVSVSVARLLQVDPLRSIAVPSGDFLDLMRHAPRGSVIVSFMGPPLLAEEQCRQLPEFKPAVIAFCPGSTADQADLAALFQRGLLQAAVVSRRRSLQSRSAGNPSGSAFDRYFQEITATNVGEFYATAEPAAHLP